MTKSELFKTIAPLFKDHGFQVIYSDHGWDEKYIKVIPPKYIANYLITSDEGIITIRCMCIFSPDNLIKLKLSDISDLRNHIGVLSQHACTPWPG